MGLFSWQLILIVFFETMNHCSMFNICHLLLQHSHFWSLTFLTTLIFPLSPKTCDHDRLQRSTSQPWHAVSDKSLHYKYLALYRTCTLEFKHNTSLSSKPSSTEPRFRPVFCRWAVASKLPKYILTFSWGWTSLQWRTGVANPKQGRS